MRSLNQLGNDLYSGKTSFPFVGKRRLWFIIAAILVIGSALVPFIRPIQFSIEFTGGSQFTVSGATSTDQLIATEAVQSVVPGATTKVATVGADTIRVQTDQMTDAETRDVAAALAEAYSVDASEVTTSFIGPSWGQDVTRQSLWGLAIFLALTFIILALYFRTWKMSAAAIIGLVDVLVITVGIYALFGFEISPAAVIGFLTILAYSLYDTTVVAILPVGAILFIGAFWLGAETLSDISLSIFVGIIVAAYSTLFVAAPLFSLFREGEPAIRQRDERVLAAREQAVASA